MRRPNVTSGPGFRGLAAAESFKVKRIVATLAALAVLPFGLATCGTAAQQGDCGDILSSAECANVRTQLGTLDPHPPADPSNRFGRCEKDGTSECLLEDKAVKLGQRLFFDRCLSAGHNTACVTCHDPAVAFVDGRTRLIQTQPTTFMVSGMPQTLQLPLITPLSPDSVTTAPPAVQAQLDSTGTPLASWDGQRWNAVSRRPQSSIGSVAMGAAAGTARHSPSLYNIAYGAVLPPPDGARVAGVIWGPWDGRYDSHWALVADVLEFGATQNTDRAHIALRIFLNHKAEYEAMTGTMMPPGFQTQDINGKYIYPRHGSPTLANRCWFDDPSKCTDTVSLAPTPEIRDEINDIFVNAGKSLSAYMRRLRSNMSAYDRFMAGDVDALSPSAQRGLQMFIGKGECVLCHNGPNFTDGRFHNLGISADDPEGRVAGSTLVTAPDGAQSGCFEGLAPAPFCPDPGRNGWQARADGQCVKDSAAVGGKTATCQRIDQPDAMMKFDIDMDCRSAASDVTDKDAQCLPAATYAPSKCAYAVDSACNADSFCQWVDPGVQGQLPRCAAKGNVAELGQFKTPTLRNVALTFPYMHNGSLYDYGPSERGETTPTDPTPHLRRVVNFYRSGGGTPPVGTRDPSIRKLDLSDSDVDDIVEFLKSLTDNSLSTDALSTQPADLVDITDCPQ